MGRTSHALSFGSGFDSKDWGSGVSGLGFRA